MPQEQTGKHKCGLSDGSHKSSHRDHPDDRHHFFLLVFFMISTLAMAQYRGMPVNLPKAASGEQAPYESAAITIDKDSRIFLNQEEVDQAALADLLRQHLEQKLGFAGSHQRG